METEVRKYEYRKEASEGRRKKLSTEEYYYDSNTIYIENNGNSEKRIRQILDEIILSHPFYAEKDINPASKYILNYNDLNSVVMIYESVIYDFIFALDEEGNEIDLMSGETLTYSEFQRYKMLKEGSSVSRSKLLAFLHPCKVKGQTPILMNEIDNWRSHLRSRDDIALMRMYVKPILNAYEKNVILVKNLPKWPREDIIDFMKSICPNSTSIRFINDSLEITFEEVYMEASFKYCILNSLKLLEGVIDTIPIYTTLEVTYIRSKQELTQSKIETGGSPYKVKNPYSMTVV